MTLPPKIVALIRCHYRAERIYCDAVSRRERLHKKIEAALRPEVQRQRRMFRRHLLRGASPDWVGSGWCWDGILNTVKYYFAYSIYWRGLRVAHAMLPQQDADIVAEAWRISGVLLLWDDRTPEEYQASFRPVYPEPVYPEKEVNP